MRRILEDAIDGTTWRISDGFFYQTLVPSLERLGLVETVYPVPDRPGEYTTTWHGSRNRRTPYLRLTDDGRLHIKERSYQWEWQSSISVGASPPSECWWDPAVAILSVALDCTRPLLEEPLPAPAEILEAAMADRVANPVEAQRHYDPWAGLGELLYYLVILEWDVEPLQGFYQVIQRRLRGPWAWPSKQAAESTARRHPVHAWRVQQEISRLTALLEQEEGEERRKVLQRNIDMLSSYAAGLAPPISPTDWPAERDALRRRAAPRIARAAAVSLWGGEITAAFLARSGTQPLGE